jgi:hypothetical protein
MIFNFNIFLHYYLTILNLALTSYHFLISNYHYSPPENGSALATILSHYYGKTGLGRLRKIKKGGAEWGRRALQGRRGGECGEEGLIFFR